MGLDTTHDCWHGSYSAFNRWRHKLAEVANIPLDLMEGYGQWRYEDMIKVLQRDPKYRWIGDAFYEYLALEVKWESLKPDPLHVLLHHSDCDGYLDVEDLEPLADRLEELIPLLPDKKDEGHIGYWHEKTQQFVDGLRLAHSRGERVEFR